MAMCLVALPSSHCEISDENLLAPPTSVADTRTIWILILIQF